LFLDERFGPVKLVLGDQDKRFLYRAGQERSGGQQRDAEGCGKQGQRSISNWEDSGC
jgi:hypothetical protein